MSWLPKSWMGNPTGHSHANTLSAKPNADTQEKVTKARGKSKHTKYYELGRAEGAVIVPAVVTTYGALGSNFKTLINKTKEEAAALSQAWTGRRTLSARLSSSSPSLLWDITAYSEPKVATARLACCKGMVCAFMLASQRDRCSNSMLQIQHSELRREAAAAKPSSLLWRFVPAASELVHEGKLRHNDQVGTFQA